MSETLELHPVQTEPKSSSVEEEFRRSIMEVDRKAREIEARIIEKSK